MSAHQQLRFLIPALCCLALLIAGSSRAGGPESAAIGAWQQMETAILRIDNPGQQPPRNLAVKVADEPGERHQGMQYLSPAQVRAWPMWFVFPEPTQTGWHMSNVAIALDIVWVDADGTVIGVARMTPETTGYAADGAIRYALELAAGRALELGIGPGTKLALTAQ